MRLLFYNKPAAVLLASFFIVTLLGLVDYLTGWELGFFVFYFFPVSLTAWHANRHFSYFTALFSAIAWFICDMLGGNHYSSVFYQYWNSIIRFSSFLIVAVFISEIRGRLENERKITTELKTALSQVKMLSGLLPICSSCKKIRNDKGYWEQIETYIHNHSEADFTHSLCNECTEKLYPGIIEKDTSPPSL